MPEAAVYRLFRRRPRLGAAGEKAAEARQILFVLSQEHADCLDRRDQADEGAAVVDDGNAPASVPRQPGCCKLLVDVGAHHDRPLDEPTNRLVRSSGEQLLDRNEPDQAPAFADGEVDCARERAAHEAVSNLPGRRARVGSRNGVLRSHRCHLNLRRTAFASSTTTVGSTDSASTKPSSEAPRETVPKAP